MKLLSFEAWLSHAVRTPTSTRHSSSSACCRPFTRKRFSIPLFIESNQTKSIAEVSGSGRKVRPQKGGGSARAGHSRPPHWRGGAKAHGPRRRDFSFKLNKKFVKLGLRVRGRLHCRGKGRESWSCCVLFCGLFCGLVPFPFLRLPPNDGRSVCSLNDAPPYINMPCTGSFFRALVSGSSYVCCIFHRLVQVENTPICVVMFSWLGLLVDRLDSTGPHTAP